MSTQIETRAQQLQKEFSQPIKLFRTMRQLWKGLESNLPPEDWEVSEYTVQEEIEIPALTEDWLLNEATPEEAEELIDGWLDEYQTNFTHPQNSLIAKEYGVEKRVTPHLARTLAYLALYQEYADRSAEQAGKIDEASARRDAAREEINLKRKNKLLSQGNAEKARKKVEETYKTDIELPGGNLEKVSSIQDLIIRNYVFEQFSPGGKSDDFELSATTLAEVAEFFSTNDTLTTSFGAFITDVSSYLRTTSDKYLLRTYSYKNTEGLSRNHADCEVLSSSAEALLQTEKPDEVSGKISELHESFLRFLTRRALSSSERTSGFLGNYPILTLTYDFLNSVLTIPHTPVYEKTLAPLVDKIFKTLFESSSVKIELQKFLTVFAEQVRDLNNKYDLDYLARTEARIPTEVKNFGASDSMRFMMGIRSGIGLVFGNEKRKGVFKSSDVIKRFQERVSSIFNSKEIHWILNLILTGSGSEMFGSDYLRASGITVDLVNNWAAFSLPMSDERINETFRERELTFTQQEMLRNAQKGSKNRTDTFRSFITQYQRELENLRVINRSYLRERPELENIDFFQTYGSYYLDPPETRYTPEEVKQKVEYNRKLWNNTLNRSMWFVSPRGDSFVADLDPELKRFEIDSITFRVDPKYKREHKVELRLAGLQKPVVLWLDTRSQLLDKDRIPLDITPIFGIHLSKLLLERLVYITSGVMSVSANPRDLVHTGMEDTPNFTYVRAHYDVLKDPRFTMSSKGALIHAEEIEDIYGIDIFQEASRRRRLGVLAPHEHLTFSKESVPDVMPAEPKPNVVAFKPELLEQFLVAQQSEIGSSPSA